MMERFPVVVLFSSVFLSIVSILIVYFGVLDDIGLRNPLFLESIMAAFYVVVTAVVAILIALTFFVARFNFVERTVCLIDLLLLSVNCILWFAIVYQANLDLAGETVHGFTDYLTLSVMVFTSNGLWPGLDLFPGAQHESILHLLIMQAMLGFVFVPMIISTTYLVISVRD